MLDDFAPGNINFLRFCHGGLACWHLTKGREKKGKWVSIATAVGCYQLGRQESGRSRRLLKPVSSQLRRTGFWPGTWLTSFWLKEPSWAGSSTRIEPKQAHSRPSPPLSTRSRRQKPRRRRSSRKSIRFRATPTWRPFWRRIRPRYPASLTRPNWLGGFPNNETKTSATWRNPIGQHYIPSSPRHIWPSLRGHWPLKVTVSLKTLWFSHGRRRKKQRTVVD